MGVSGETEAVIRHVRALFGEIEDTIARVQDPAARLQVAAFEWRMLNNIGQDPSYTLRGGNEVQVEPHAARMLRLKARTVDELLARDLTLQQVADLSGEPRGTLQSQVRRARGRRG